MRIMGETPLTWDEWDEWNKNNSIPKQFDRKKFIALSLTKNDLKTKDLINDIVDHILSVSNPIKITMFGSRVRKNYNKNSDIDICVIFNKKSDITRKYDNMVETLTKTSPIDLDVKSPSIHRIKNTQNDMSKLYYYVMRDSIILYQQGDNSLYEFLERACSDLDYSYQDSKSKSTNGFMSYLSVKWSLNSIFLASYIPIPPFQNIIKHIPTGWKINYTQEELKYIIKLVKPVIIHREKNQTKSYHIARKIYKSVLNDCIKKDLLNTEQISKLRWIL